MGTVVSVVVANLLVGACIGLTGIAGFLLPIFYVGALALAPTEALALSFAAFLVSGVLGTPAYRATGDLPVRETAWLAAGSLAGALVGVRVGLVLPASVLTALLYVVVLCSGVSVLVRMRPRRSRDEADVPSQAGSALLPGWALAGIGAATAVICAATGAGGPVLVVPILMLLGLSPRAAVGVGLADSVAIAVPSAVGYFLGGGVSAFAWSLLVPAVVGHGAGVLLGSLNAHRIDPSALKAIVAVGSVAVALLKLVPMLL